jgi:hypothetical protein
LKGKKFGNMEMIKLNIMQQLLRGPQNRVREELPAAEHPVE